MATKDARRRGCLLEEEDDEERGDRGGHGGAPGARGETCQVPGEHVRAAPVAGRRGGPEAQNRGARRRKKNKATTVASTLTPSPSAEEINVSCPSVASSSDVSFPAIAGVDCIPDASDRTSTGPSERSRIKKQRGKVKEENFVQSMRKMQLEGEKMCNPLAQGLPYTTDEPQGLPYSTDEPEGSCSTSLRSLLKLDF
ncbi:hypothetical protein ACP70R_035608 [Stipagrostis hirtigluma subsp. patula]